MLKFLTLPITILFHLLIGYTAAKATEVKVLSDFEVMAGNPKVLFVGNSILAPVYNLFVSEGAPYECTSIAFPGANINDQLNGWIALTSDQKKSFNYILLEVGINNVFPGAESFIAAYQNMVNIIRAGKSDGCIIIAATLTPSKGSANVGLSNWLALNAAIRGEGSNPITGIDIVMTTNTTRLDLNGDYYMDVAYDRGDGVHPNSAGQQVIKKNFLEALGNIPYDPPDPPVDPPVDPPDPPVDTTDPGPVDPPDTVIIPIPPKTPTLLKAEISEEKKIVLSWKDNSTNESGFVISRYPISNPTHPFQTTVNANIVTFTDITVEAGTAYAYMIKAVNKDGSSAFSDKLIVAVPSSSELMRSREGLVAFYNFSYNPDFIVYDLSGNGEPLNLYPSVSSLPDWTENGLYLGNSGHFDSPTAEKIINRLGESNELTVECWIKPSDPEYIAAGRIISLGKNEDNIGFVLEQNYISGSGEKLLTYNARLNTSSTVTSGLPTLSQQENGISSISMHDITFVRDSSGHEFIYVDGKKVTEGFRPGLLNVWNNDCRLLLGNSESGDLPWKGRIYMIAIYDRALSAEDISKNFNAGPYDRPVKQDIKYDVSFSPNPFRDQGTIKISPDDVSDMVTSSPVVRLTDAYGNVFFSEELFNPAIEYSKNLELTGLPSGLYFIQLISEKKQQTLKIIKN